MKDDRTALVERLYAHVAWADARVVEGLKGVQHAEALAMFNHVLGAEEIWLARLEGRASELGVWPELSVEDCARAAGKLGQGFRSYCAGLSEGDWSQDCRYTTTDGRDYATPVEDILVHVALHGAYHRGQIATLLRQAGDKPVATDFIEFARMG